MIKVPEQTLRSMSAADLRPFVAGHLYLLARDVTQLEQNPGRPGYADAHAGAKRRFEEAFNDARSIGAVERKMGYGPYFRQLSRQS